MVKIGNKAGFIEPEVVRDFVRRSLKGHGTKEVYLYSSPCGWALNTLPTHGSSFVGCYDETIPIRELVNDIDHVAAGMCRH